MEQYSPPIVELLVQILIHKEDNAAFILIFPYLIPKPDRKI